MLKRLNILSLTLNKQIACFILFTGLGIYSFGSMGGGNKPKSTSPSSQLGFTPVRTTNGFTLKAGPHYRGSSIFGETKTNTSIMFNSVVTYQKGNTTYILPYKHKISLSGAKSNLQAVNLKVNINH